MNTVTFGSMALKLTHKYTDYQSRDVRLGGRRKKITGFTKEAKRNFLWRLQTLNYKLLAWWVFRVFRYSYLSERFLFRTERFEAC